ncbi:MAG: hypothetical protein ACK4ZJ_18740, partial [Allorhizobium sp.]
TGDPSAGLIPRVWVYPLPVHGGAWPPIAADPPQPMPVPVPLPPLLQTRPTLLTPRVTATGLVPQCDALAVRALRDSWRARTSLPEGWEWPVRGGATHGADALSTDAHGADASAAAAAAAAETAAETAAHSGAGAGAGFQYHFSLLLTGHADGSVCVWLRSAPTACLAVAAPTLHLLHELHLPSVLPTPPATAAVTALDLCPDSLTLAAGFESGEVA